MKPGMKLTEVYGRMLSRFGPRNWWPMRNTFKPPELEVCVGAILTQNTSWGNVERALSLMKAKGMTGMDAIEDAGLHELEEAVRPSGFYKQKAERLKTFTEFVRSFGGFPGFSRKVTRGQLLGLKGIGPETADSILLYALGRPLFVVDAYTRRVFTRLGFPDRKGYEAWRGFFEDNLPRDVALYREFHALIVEHAKTYCRKKPLCSNCFLAKNCKKRFIS
jgi:endonuclease-3 related protein